MRLVCIFAIVIGLSFPDAAMVSRQQDAAGSSNSAGQASPPPAPAEKSPTESPTPAPAPAENAAPAEKKPEGAPEKKTDAASAKGTTKRRKSVAPTPEGTPKKVVVREGGASEPAAQIAPDVSPAEATRQRQHAEQLLSATDLQLQQLAGRSLDARQQETVGQIRNYVGGARSALKEGDVLRASTLAQKAHLLSEDLVRH